jgi:hypothetical protein
MTHPVNPTVGIRDRYTEQYGFHDTERHVFKARRGLDRGVVGVFSAM